MICSQCKREIKTWYQRKDEEKTLFLCVDCRDKFDGNACFICGNLTNVMYSETLYEGENIRLCWVCKNKLTKMQWGAGYKKEDSDERNGLSTNGYVPTFCRTDSEEV